MHSMHQQALVMGMPSSLALAMASHWSDQVATSHADINIMFDVVINIFVQLLLDGAAVRRTHTPDGHAVRNQQLFHRCREFYAEGAGPRRLQLPPAKLDDALASAMTALKDSLSRAVQLSLGEVEGILQTRFEELGRSLNVQLQIAPEAPGRERTQTSPSKFPTSVPGCSDDRVGPVRREDNTDRVQARTEGTNVARNPSVA
ncbi:unnamed protein product, partial [Symbiodinium sp. KB8]